MSGNKLIIKQTPTTELLYTNKDSVILIKLLNKYTWSQGALQLLAGNLVKYLKYFYTKYRKLKNTQYSVNVPVAK